MAIEVETKDTTALSDSELAEMADLCVEGDHHPGHQITPGLGLRL